MANMGISLSASPSRLSQAHKKHNSSATREDQSRVGRALQKKGVFSRM
jgi:hypothetical protein